MLSKMVERFIEKSPVTVMARAALENALAPEALDKLFDEKATLGYTRELLFSSVVDLMAVVVCKIEPSITIRNQKWLARWLVTRRLVSARSFVKWQDSRPLWYLGIESESSTATTWLPRSGASRCSEEAWRGPFRDTLWWCSTRN